MDKKKLGKIIKEVRKNMGLIQEYVVEDFKEKTGGDGFCLRTMSRIENGYDEVTEEKYIDMLRYYDIPYVDGDIKILYEKSDFYNLFKEEGIAEGVVDTEDNFSLKQLKFISQFLYDQLTQAQNYEKPRSGEVKQLEAHLQDLEMKIRAGELRNEFLDNEILLFFNKRRSYRINKLYSNKIPLNLEEIYEYELYFRKKNSSKIKQTNSGINYITVKNYEYDSFYRQREEIAEKHGFSSVEDFLTAFPNLKIQSKDNTVCNEKPSEIIKEEIMLLKMEVFKEVFKEFFYSKDRDIYYRDQPFDRCDPDWEEYQYPEDWEEEFYRWYKK